MVTSRLRQPVIRSLEMAETPGMRGKDVDVFDNLDCVEVQFLSPRCTGEARSPLGRLTLKLMKRERKAVTQNLPANPAEQSCGGGRQTNSRLNRRQVEQANGG